MSYLQSDSVLSTELETVKLDYESSLDDLTSNNKPIISSLTMIAEENIHASGVIVEAIENRLRRVIYRFCPHSLESQAKPPHKLPVLYLMDSIVKNIGKDFVSLFSNNIVPLFSESYRSVDARTKGSLQRLASTWHSIFSENVMQSIIQLFGHTTAPSDSTPPQISTIPTPFATSSPTLHAFPPSLSKVQSPSPTNAFDAPISATQIQNLILSKQQQLFQDPTASVQIEALQQVSHFPCILTLRFCTWSPPLP